MENNIQINLDFKDTGKTYNGCDIWEAPADQEFWALWKENKEAIKKMGISVNKYSGDWTVVKWVKSKMPATEKMAYRVVEPDPIDPALLKEIQSKDKLLSYQVPHVQKLIYGLERHGAVLDASDAGTGKTFTALSVCKELGRRPIVVSPKSVLYIWKKCCEYFEIEPYLISNYEQYQCNHTPYLNVKITKKMVRGKKKKNIQCHWDVPLDSIVIFDEAHRCKDNRTINSHMLVAARDSKCLMMSLSATVGDNPKHLYAVGYSLNMFTKQGYFPWMLAHGVVKERFGFAFTGGLEYLSMIHKQIFPHMRGVRMKIKDLGDKFPDNLIITDCYDMSNHAEKIDRIYTNLNKYIRSLYAKMQHDKINYLTELLRARQEVELLKVETMVEMANDLLEEDHSVVIFVNFNDTVKMLMERLKTKCVIWGNQDATARDKNVADFQSDKERVIICNIRAGGVGISLHDLNGNHSRVSLISPSYSAQDLKQALGRIHRAGAKSKAIQKIIFCAGTVEEKMAKKVKKKIKNIETLNDNEINGVFFEETA